MTDNRNKIGKKSKILIVDDHPIFRFGIIRLINREKDMEICGETDNPEDTFKLIKDLNPDLIIADISLKDTSGLELIKEVTAKYKNLPVLVLSMHDESIYAERVLRLGAKGYIMKEVAYESVINAIHLVLEGKIYVSEKISEDFINKYVDGSGETQQPPINSLTDRELEIFKLIGMGYATKQISAELCLSINTINTYKDKIKNKLKLKNAHELMQQAVFWASIDAGKI